MEIEIYEAQKLPNRLNLKELHKKSHYKVKHKENILKIARENWFITLHGTPMRSLTVVFLRTFAGNAKLGGYIQNTDIKKKSDSQEYYIQQNCPALIKDR